MKKNSYSLPPFNVFEVSHFHGPSLALAIFGFVLSQKLKSRLSSFGAKKACDQFKCSRTRHQKTIFVENKTGV